MASTYNLKIEAGATFRQSITWTVANGQPTDMTGYTGRMQMRAKLTDPAPLLELNSENGGIVITPATGKIEIVIDDLQTAGLVNGVYDLEVIGPTPQTGRADVYRLLSGSVEVRKNVTR